MLIWRSSATVCKTSVMLSLHISRCFGLNWTRIRSICEQNVSGQEAYFRAAEDRAHLKVDRARQDAKQWQQRHEGAERVHRDAVVAMQGQLNLVASRPATSLVRERVRIPLLSGEADAWALLRGL
ncbi:hypothetical protein [Dyella silvae]|uniref:hypothetical protein n=1 Tax=Dyella silvae TaxID=2994424 RepID=UPI002263EBA1|nr:hypothetical protein [Dyella silvae]